MDRAAATGRVNGAGDRPRPPMVLCSGSLGSAPLGLKLEAAAAAGFTWVSVYGNEYRAAIDAGVDVPALLSDLGLRVAEVDGVAITLSDAGQFADALEIATAVAARSITIVETRPFDPADPDQMDVASQSFARACDRAADSGVLVHLEPFAWSDLASATIAARIVTSADRPNGGLLLDLWHHIRGPDDGHLDQAIPASMLFGLQVADTVSEPWPNVRDECMGQRLLPGDGAGDLAHRLAELATRGPLPPIGVEVFGPALDRYSPLAAAREAHRALDTTLNAADV